MQSVFRRVRRIQRALSRRHDSLLLQGVGPLDAYKPVYDLKPSWSNQWTYPIIFAQIGVSCALTELIVHHWTEPAPAAADDEEPAFVLRPLWQRASAAFAQFGLGAFVCVLLLNSRARTVRRLYVLPASAVTPSAALAPKLPGGRVLVAQNVYHFRGQGRVFPFAKTRLTEGFAKDELGFEAPGVRGKFYLGLSGAQVNGKLEPVWQTREAIFRLWYGARGTREMSKFGWVE